MFREIVATFVDGVGEGDGDGDGIFRVKGSRIFLFK